MIKINGKECNDAQGKTMMTYLKENNFNTKLIAVELNGNILSKKEYDTYIINDEDVIEIVHFVGGG